MEKLRLKPKEMQFEIEGLRRKLEDDADKIKGLETQNAGLKRLNAVLDTHLQTLITVIKSIEGKI